MTELLAFVAVGVGTYGLRASGLVRRGSEASPSPTLGLIAPVVLAAVVADQLFVDERSVGIRGDWLLAATVSAVVAWRTRSAALTMLAGLGVVWLGDLIV